MEEYYRTGDQHHKEVLLGMFPCFPDIIECHQTIFITKIGYRSIKHHNNLQIAAHTTADNAAYGISWKVLVNDPNTTKIVNIVVAFDIGVLPPDDSLRDDRENDPEIGYEEETLDYKVNHG